MINQPLQDTIELRALINAKQNNLYTITLEQLPCEKNQENCCGGYCGSLLWKKMLPHPSANAQTTLKSSQPLEIAKYVTLSLSMKQFLYLQSFLWLCPTLLLLGQLALLPSTWWALLLALCTTSFIWLLLNHTIKKHHFGLRIKHCDLK